MHRSHRCLTTNKVLLIIILIILIHCNFAEATYSPLEYLQHGTAKHFTERDQCVLLLFMINNKLKPYQASNNQLGAPIKASTSTLRRWWKHFQWYGETPFATAKRNKFKRLRGKTKMKQVHKMFLKYVVDQNPGLFLDEMQQALLQKFGIKFHISTIHRNLTTTRSRGGIGYSLKLLTFKAVQASKKERRLYLARLRQIENPANFIFVDETHIGKNSGRRRRGWGQLGVPVRQYELFVGENLSPHIDHYTMIGAVDINGFVKEACQCIYKKKGKNDTNPKHGTVDAERFYQWVLAKLIPVLGRRIANEPRSTVVLDNATIHKDPRIEQAIIDAGAEVIWTAAYSPDLNPIERAFSNYKRYLRRSYKLFHRDQKKVHRRALDYSLDSEFMKNNYNGKQLEGSIRNVRVSNSNREEEEAFCFMIVVAVGALLYT